MTVQHDLGATPHDSPRPDATGPDYEYSLTMEEVAERYAENNLPRTLRTVQRYCAKGHLDARKVATTFGDKYLVAPYSVSRHIAQIQETIAFTQSLGNRDNAWRTASCRDRSGQVRKWRHRHCAGRSGRCSLC